MLLTKTEWHSDTVYAIVTTLTRSPLRIMTNGGGLPIARHDDVARIECIGSNTCNRVRKASSSSISVAWKVDIPVPDPPGNSYCPGCPAGFVFRLILAPIHCGLCAAAALRVVLNTFSHCASISSLVLAFGLLVIVPPGSQKPIWQALSPFSGKLAGPVSKYHLSVVVLLAIMVVQIFSTVGLQLLQS